MEWEFVPVPIDLKAHVIGRRHSVINEMMAISGATIEPGSRHHAGFIVSGRPQEIEMAKQFISEKLEELENKWEELVEIPDRYKGRVIGKHRATLREIENQTGVKLFVKDGEVYIVCGTQQQRRHAKRNIGTIVAVARLTDFEKEFYKVCSYVDGCHLPENCKLKLEEMQVEDRMPLPGLQTQYRLKPAEHCERKNSYHDRNDPVYQSNLKDEVLMSLRKIKENRETDESPKADMWCHLGTSIIRVPDEEDVIQKTWDIEEITERFQRPDTGEKIFWKVSFRERDDIPEDIFKRTGFKEITEDNEYISRYDLTYLTPCFYQLRCKVWVAKSSVKKKLDDIPIPFSDVKNVLEEIQFEDETTQSRCRGWLVLKSRKYLQTDILFPGCELDCRFTMRERRDRTAIRGDVPEIEVRRALSAYLSRLTLTDKDAFGLLLPDRDFPEGFHLLHKRCCKRKMYSTRAGFFAILSQEDSWSIDFSGNETSRESTDLHLHSEECDKLLSSTDWQPETIVQKLPEFIQFVKEIQDFVVREMKGNGSTRTVPPEIRARGPLALEAYNNALAEGQACVKRVPLMIVGQDRAGKTSVKKSLKGICFNRDEDSTLGIEVDDYLFKVTTEIWKTGEIDEEANIDTTVTSFEHSAARWIAEKLTMHEKIAEVKQTSSTESAGYDFEEIDDAKEGEPYETLSDANLLESSINPASTNTTDDEPNLSTREVRDPKELEPEEDLLIKTLEKLPDFDDVVKLLPQFLRENWEDDKEDIYSILWDFAGQSVYYVTHPIFLTRRAIYFLVYDLSRNPSDKAKPLVKRGVYREIEDKYNLKTNFDYLDFWMSSLASLVSDCQQVEPEKLVPLRKFPAVFLVCTHADQPYCDHNPFKLASEIFGDLKNKPYGAHLFDVFCVDNTKSGTESVCKEIVRLREAVHVVSKELPHVTEAIPIKWLKYENVLRVLMEKDQKFISLSTAKKIASKCCNINDNEVQTVLTFLHDLRVLIHFDDSPELSELVTLDIQWLIDVFKNVITVRAHHEERDFAPLWEKLEKKGILEENLLKHVWNSLVPQKKTHESLIAIMEKFSLMCSWPSSDDLCNKHYLVPSMLRTLPPKQISDLVNSAQLPSLFLKFDTGRVPPGLFPRFVLEFFQWCRKEFPGVDLPKTYINFARFNIFPNQGLSLVLLCHSSTIEVVVLSVKSAIDVVDVDSIRAFRNQLTLIIDRVWKKFFWVKNIRCEVSYLCPVCSHGRVASFCPQHHEESCKQEECLHFILESDLLNKKQVVCTNSVTALDNRIHAEQFAPWISSVKEKQMATHQRGGGPQFGKGGNEETPVIPCKSVTSVQLQPQIGAESGGKLVPFAQRNCQIQISAENQLEPTHSGRDAFQDSDGTLVPFSQGNGYESLVLPHKVSESLQLTSDPPKEVVDKLLHSLQLYDASLEDPKPETEKWIRCLTRDAKDRGRTDVVKYLREIMPAGTTGPMLPDTLPVQNIPNTQLKELTIDLSGRHDWELFAEKLGLTPAEIRFLDKRTMNQVLEVLNVAAKKYLITVGDLYDVLKDCGLPVIADIL